MAEEKERATRVADESLSAIKSEADGEQARGDFENPTPTDDFSISRVGPTTEQPRTNTGTESIGETSHAASSLPRIRTAMRSRVEKEGTSSRAASPALQSKVTFDAATEKGPGKTVLLPGTGLTQAKQKSLLFTEDDLKKEIGKLESSESFHADFAQARKPGAQSDQGVSVKELCRKTSAGIKPRSTSEVFDDALSQPAGSTPIVKDAAAASEAPPSMDFLAQRQISDATTLSNFNIGEADFDEHRHSRLHGRHLGKSQSHHHHKHKHKKCSKKDVDHTTPEASPSSSVGALVGEKPSMAPSMVASSVGAPLISIDETLMDDEDEIGSSEAMKTSLHESSGTKPLPLGIAHRHPVVQSPARHSYGFSSEEEIASFAESVTLKHLANIIPKAGISEDRISSTSSAGPSLDAGPSFDAGAGLGLDAVSTNSIADLIGAPISSMEKLAHRSTNPDIGKDQGFVPMVVVDSGTPLDENNAKETTNSKHSQRHSGKRHHHGRHHHHGRKGSRKEMQTTEVLSEEDRNLPGADVDGMSSHRLGDFHGLRRHKITPRAHMASIVHVGSSGKSKSRTPIKSDNLAPPTSMDSKPEDAKKKKFDHSPHEVFVELEELRVGETGEEMEWREMARWIKFEEDIEEGANRWGRPHVAMLSFHSLLELRRGLENGTILLDMEESDFPHIISAIVEEMIEVGQIREKNRQDVLKALLLKHRQHQQDHVSGGESILSRFHRNISSISFKSTGLDEEEPFKKKRHGMDTTDVNDNDPEALPFVAVRGTNEDRVGLIKDDGQTEGYYQLHAGLDSSATPPSMAASVPRFCAADSEMSGMAGTGTGVQLSDVVAPDSKDTTSSTPVLFTVGHDGESDDEKRDRPKPRAVSTVDNRSNNNRKDVNSVAYKMPEEQKDIHRAEILKKIPEGAEAFAVLVGAVGFLEQPAMGFIRLSEGRHLGNLTEVPLPVRFIFILLGPDDQEIVNYHEIGRSISTLMANTSFHEVAYQAEERESLLQAINEFLDDSVVLPPGALDSKLLSKQLALENPIRRRKKKEDEKKLLAEEDGGDGDQEPEDDPLARTGRPFGGAIRDIKRRYKHYLSDFKDGLNMQCLASFFFIYFACLSPAITFGGLLADKTNNWIGVTETLVSTCVCGVLFSLLAGQPLLIIGYTGPLLVFEESLYEFCDHHKIQFIVFRAWVGIWIAIIAVCLVAAEGSTLASLLTRFSEEIFALLISLIFVYEVFNKIMKIFSEDPLRFDDTAVSLNDSSSSSSSSSLNSTMMSMMNHSLEGDLNEAEKSYPNPNTGLLATILLFATFFIATYLKKFRNSQFLGRSMRRALGDFGIPIAIILVVSFDLLIQDTWSQKLEVPDGLNPTDSVKRPGWFVNPLGIHGETIPIWMPFIAVVPAVLVFILIFIETLIASQIVNKKERNLKKGGGYHLDILLIGMMAGGCGLMGVPWHTAATVRSVAHTSSLSVMSKSHAPGEAPKLLEVKEQRLTNLLVNTMVGLSIALSSVLRKIPVPVLFGVFLYMGISSMAGIQFLTRIGLLFRPLKHHPQVGFVRKVRTYKMHLFTLIQIGCLAVLWAVKSTEAALGFPFFLIMLIPMRKLILPRLFSSKELNELDKEGVDEVDEDDPGLYEEAVVAD